MTVHEANWMLTIADITNAGASATVTLKSGVKLKGWPDRKVSRSTGVLLMYGDRHRQSGITHTIDWEEIAAITGEK